MNRYTGKSLEKDVAEMNRQLEAMLSATGTTLTEAVKQTVNAKLHGGEISIGKPALKAGETLSIEGNRYHINSPETA